MITQWRATSAEVKADVDARVLQAERAKLADKYEKCFRKIIKVYQVSPAGGLFEWAVKEIEKVYKP